MKGQTSAEQLKDYQAWRMAHAEDNPMAAAKAAREVVTTLNGISALTQNYQNGAADMHKFTVEEAKSLQNMIQAIWLIGMCLASLNSDFFYKKSKDFRLKFRSLIFFSYFCTINKVIDIYFVRILWLKLFLWQIKRVV